MCWNLNHNLFSWTVLSSRSLVIIPRIVVFAATKAAEGKKEEADSEANVNPNLEELKDQIVNTEWSGAKHWEGVLQENPKAIEHVHKGMQLWAEHCELFDGDVDGPYYVRYDRSKEEKFPRNEMVELEFTKKGEVKVRPFDLMVFIPYIVDINTIGLDTKNQGVLGRSGSLVRRQGFRQRLLPRKLQKKENAPV